MAAVDVLCVPGYVPYEARAAFWARTGAATADHDLDNVAVQFVAEPGTAALGSGVSRRKAAR